MDEDSVRGRQVSGQCSATVEVTRQPDGMWRWRWVQRDTEGREETSLVSHMAFDSESEAASSAQSAYPDTTVQQPTTETAGRPRRRRRRLLISLALAGALVLGRRLAARHRP